MSASPSSWVGIDESYPRARAPVLPILSWPRFGRYRNDHVPCVLDAGETLFVSSGMNAVTLALQSLGVGKGDSVLVPAYHCRSFVEPIYYLGAKAVFYRVHEDVSVDVDHLEGLVDASTRALIAVHYFGFPQNITRLRAFCDRRGLALVEDCAHAFFGQFGGQPLGSFGDFAIASPRKFFPVFDGGCLISHDDRLQSIALRDGGLGYHTRAILHPMEYAIHYRRLQPINGLLSMLIGFKEGAWGWIKHRRSGSAVQRPASPGAAGYQFFDPDRCRVRMSLPSRWLVAAMSRTRIVDRRRAHYRFLADALASVPHARPLFPELPDAVVPYMFPFLIDNPEAVFPPLKRQGVPIWRWDDIDTDICPVATDYSKRLLQLPCHQDLTIEELGWMADRIRQTLGARA